MFLLDNLFLLPARGIMAVFREIHDAVEQESGNEAETIRSRLSEIYMMLETQRMTEEEFQSEEKELLDRLDEMESEAEGAKSRIESDDDRFSDPSDEAGAAGFQDQGDEKEDDLDRNLVLAHHANGDPLAGASE